MSDPARYRPLERFTERASDYAKFRPGYPAAAIDFILAGFSRREALVAADIGAGTGISSRLLADAGVRVIAVEPNDAMRSAARRHTRVTFRAGTGEATGIAAGSVDLVTYFQAFHWVEPAAALAEARRVLRSRGRFAAIWNDRQRSDPFTAAYGEIIERFAVNPEVVDRASFAGPLEPRLREVFPRVAVREFPHTVRMDASSLLGRARSSSYLPAGEGFAPVEAALMSLHDRHADHEGFVTFAYAATVYRADR
ncbi:MAG: class I SAM-dependent methyltransferase [Candidatus Eremiobacteraeota bacterium]|nr:class I SAM-dependent methyltransferase [Candidatus Eremiobacteraeota bacterium]